MQRATVILRFGIGSVRPRSGRQVARLLDVSPGRVRLLERRGVRALAGIDRGAACLGAGEGSLAAVLEAGVRLANTVAAALDEAGPGTVALDEDGQGAVAGARKSGGTGGGGSPPPEDGPVSSAGPSLGDSFGDDGSAVDEPLFLLLVAIVVACLASAGREIMRAVR
jgi:hypothetical protein